MRTEGRRCGVFMKDWIRWRFPHSARECACGYCVRVQLCSSRNSCDAAELYT